MNKPHEQTAAEFVRALETLINNPENKNNFHSYLSMHFETWLRRFANTPENITSEIKHFAEMEI